MKLIHTADWHLGLDLHGVSLLEHQRSVLTALCELALKNKADALLLCGDVFDRVQATPQAIALYDEIMALFLNEAHIPVYLIAGNHDAAPRLGSLKSVLSRLRFHVMGRLDPFASPIETDDCVFFLLPYFTADEARYFFPDTEIQGMAQAMDVVLSQMKRRLLPNKRNILLSHCFAAGGSVSGSDRSAQVGGSARVALASFEGFDYAALGHLHAAQSPAPGVRYAGTPLPYSFAEAGQQKSVTLYDTASGTITPLPLPMPYTLIEKKGSAEELLSFAQDAADPSVYYSLALTDKSVDFLIERELRQRLPNLLLLQGLSPVPAGGVQLTPQELASLSPMGLLRQYMESEGLPPPDEEQTAWFLAALEEGEKTDAPA